MQNVWQKINIFENCNFDGTWSQGLLILLFSIENILQYSIKYSEIISPFQKFPINNDKVDRVHEKCLPVSTFFEGTQVMPKAQACYKCLFLSISRVASWVVSKKCGYVLKLANTIHVEIFWFYLEPDYLYGFYHSPFMLWKSINSLKCWHVI